ncbi:MAG TPA: TlpA disulfide reductase family protein [Candidatus Dormibacteraeota bacterium]|nr:TlpA disulfide reductase family protein [Candidatus Dormibacteraeota bacterium]
MKHQRPLFLAAALAVAALLPSMAFAAPPPRKDAPAPAFSLPLANGRGKVSLAAFRGHPVYLNYFAAWCPPCNAEAPSLAKLARAFAPKGVVVIGIDELEGAKQALGFALKYQLPYRIALDTDGAVGAAYGVYALPVHVFIDRRGRVAYYRLGEMDAAQIKSRLESIARER